MKNITLVIIFLNSLLLFGQTPSNDPHWQLVWEDNFNTLNTNLWEVKNNFDHYSGLANNFSEGEPQVYTNRTDNVFVSNGHLILKVKQETYTCPSSSLNDWGCSRQDKYGVPYNYTSGWVETKQAYNTQFGYIESKIKLPNGHGFWPAFWTFKGSGVLATNEAEIDIFEMLGSDVNAPNIMGTNIHKEYCDVNQPDYPVCANIPNYGLDLKPTNFDYTSWHTYGIKWSPNKIVWYVDGSPVRTITSHGIIDPVRIILNFAIEPWALPNQTTPFPSEMIIDYVKVYNLSNDCNTNLNVCNYNFSSHDNRVKKNINIGNGSCNNYLNSGDNIFLRASEGVLINGSFTVPLGAELYIDVNTCY